MIMGQGYEASPDLQTSVAGAEILPSPPADWNRPYKFYKFSFFNDQDCHIIINGDGKQKYLRAKQGFNLQYPDKGLTSVIIVEDGITYNYIGAY